MKAVSITTVDELNAVLESLSVNVLQPTEYLTCCCCGSETAGRQWWNRDTGFGLCQDCIKLNGVDSVAYGKTADSFGVRGYHRDLQGE